MLTERAHLAQDHAEWHHPVATPPLRRWQTLRAATTRRRQGNPGGQAPGGDASRSRGRRASGDLRRHQQQLGSCVLTLAALHAQAPSHGRESFEDPSLAWGWNETLPQNQSSSKHVMNCFQHKTGVMYCLAQPPAREDHHKDKWPYNCIAARAKLTLDSEYAFALEVTCPLKSSGASLDFPCVAITGNLITSRAIRRCLHTCRDHDSAVRFRPCE